MLKIIIILVARLGDLRADHDANCTYEGENNVLVQQASNWLLNFSSNFNNGKPIPSPLKSIDFLAQGKKILQTKFTCMNMEETLEPESKFNEFYFMLNWIFYQGSLIF